jgi:hypothetical protein
METPQLVGILRLLEVFRDDALCSALEDPSTFEKIREAYESGATLRKCLEIAFTSTGTVDPTRLRNRVDSNLDDIHAWLANLANNLEYGILRDLEGVVTSIFDQKDKGAV